MNAPSDVTVAIKPDMLEVQSSQAAKIGYDEYTQGLFVEFKSRHEDQDGPTWRYSPVDRREFEALLNGESVGRFVAGLKKNPLITALRVVDTVEF